MCRSAFAIRIPYTTFRLSHHSPHASPRSPCRTHTTRTLHLKYPMRFILVGQSAWNTASVISTAYPFPVANRGELFPDEVFYSEHFTATQGFHGRLELGSERFVKVFVIRGATGVSHAQRQQGRSAANNAAGPAGLRRLSCAHHHAGGEPRRGSEPARKGRPRETTSLKERFVTRTDYCTDAMSTLPAPAG